MGTEPLAPRILTCDRREFLQAAAGLAVLGPALTFAGDSNRHVPRRPLGSTGLLVPMLGVGTARAGRELDRAAAAELFHAALDAGAGYFDTGPASMGYGRGSEWLAPVLRERRGEAFVVVKVFADDDQRALRLLRENLDDLEIDRADLVLVHSIGDARIDPERLLGRRGALAALGRAKADGLARAIGVSAHDRPGKVRLVVERSPEIDAVMIPINATDRAAYQLEDEVGATAARRGLGVIGFKVLGGTEGMSSDRIEAAFRDAWSQPGLATAVVGPRDRAELGAAVAQARAFRPLRGAERAALRVAGRSLADARGAPLPYGPRA